MRYSKLFPKTIKQTPQDATLISHQLLYRAGFIRESTAGRYYLLPLGLRVHQKIQQIIKKQMDASGAQEMVTPVLHPLSLWAETNRNSSVGFELMKIKDRNDGEFVLGGTAEEMFVDLIRKFQISYRDLPVNLYQFSTKFRDEMRARGGLLRVREFMMKDGYSFHIDEADFKKEYQNMWQTYLQIFKQLDLDSVVVESDNGYIGGEYCHEFVVVTDAGESKFFVNEDRSYAAHEDVAKFIVDEKNLDEPEKALEEVDAKRGKTMEDGVQYHKLPLWQQIKDVMYVDDKGRFILAVIRGDYDVNEIKLAHVINAYSLRAATEDEIRNLLHSEPGFISPVGIKDNLEKDVELLVIADETLKTIKNAYGGSNKQFKDLMNINLGRDYQPDQIADIALAREGDKAPDGKGVLKQEKGVEVGNIFQLGYHYSSKMSGANYINQNGQESPYYMGCYGIGIGRTLATIVEIHHDDKGIIWPESVAPYQLHLVGLDLNNEQISAKAEECYQHLTAQGIEVLFDDRLDVSAGAKFADADLIGIPHRVVVSARSGDQFEYKSRNANQSELISLDDLIKKVS